MSTHALSWAWRQEVGDAGAKLVLLKLADQANDRGECWPSHRTLATECEMSRRTVQRKLEILYDLGLVEADHRTRKTGGDSSLLYRVGMHAVSDATGDEQTSVAVRQSDAPRCVTADVGGASQVTHHEPSLEPTSPADAGESDALAPHSRGDVVWGILKETFGQVAPRTNAHAKRSKAAADLRRLGATPDSVRYAIKRWAFVLPPGTMLTDTGLATHFPQLAQGFTPSTPLERQSQTAAQREWVIAQASDPDVPLSEVMTSVSAWHLDHIETGELFELAESTRAEALLADADTTQEAA